MRQTSCSDSVYSPVGTDSSGANERATRPDTAAGCRARGFDAVLEQERALQALTDAFSDDAHGQDAQAIARVLRNHHLRLGDNIAILRQRYDTSIPEPRTVRKPTTSLRNSTPAGAAESLCRLPELVAQHLHTIESIEMLLAQRPDGQRGELVLNEVVSSHRAMAWMLTALVNEGAQVHDRQIEPIVAVAAPLRSRDSWEIHGDAQCEAVRPALQGKSDPRQR